MTARITAGAVTTPRITYGHVGQTTEGHEAAITHINTVLNYIDNDYTIVVSLSSSSSFIMPEGST